MIYNLGILLYLILFSYLSWRNLNLAIFLLIVFLPTYAIRFEIGPLPSTILELMLLVIFFVWLIKEYKKKKTLQQLLKPIHKLKWPIIIFLIGATISIFTSPSIRDAAGIWKAFFIEPILFLIVLVNVFKEKKDYQLILYALGITTIGFGILAIFQKITGWGIYQDVWKPIDVRRITLFFTSPNAVGLYLGPIIALYIGWLITELKNLPKTIFKIIVIALGVLTVYFAVSRGALIGILAAIIFILFFSWSKKWTTLITAFLFGLILTIKQSALLISSLLTFQVASGQLRLQLWKGSLSMLMDNPLWGAGLAGFSKLFEKYRPQNYTEVLIYPHNIFLNFWSEIGLLGLIGFILIIFTFFAIGFKIHKRDAISKDDKLITISLMAAMISILIHGLVDVPYFKNDLSVIFWVFIAILLIIYNKNKKLILENEK